MVMNPIALGQGGGQCPFSAPAGGRDSLTMVRPWLEVCEAFQQRPASGPASSMRWWGLSPSTIPKPRPRSSGARAPIARPLGALAPPTAARLVQPVNGVEPVRHGPGQGPSAAGHVMGPRQKRLITARPPPSAHGQGFAADA